MEIKNVETFKAKAQGKGWPTKVAITGTEWNIQVDEPVDDGGSNSGPNPMQYFVASLAGCQNEQANVVAGELNLIIDRIEIEVEVDLDLSGFMGERENSNGSYKQVRFSAEVYGDVSEDLIHELGKKVDERCPILALLRTSDCSIISSWRKG